MANAGIDQHVVSLTELFSSTTRFYVPRFQRNYSWGAPELKELWDDLIELEEDRGHKYHYLGYIVVSPSSGYDQGTNPPLDIIDGQQRIATLSFLIRAVIQCLADLEECGKDPDNNSKRRVLFKERFIETLDTETMKANPRLKLNRNNNDFYLKNILTFKEQTGPIKTSSSNKLMWNALMYFYDELKIKFIGKKPRPDAGERLARFFAIIENKLVLSLTTIADQSSAYQLFETLNYRGKDLSPSDLVKNLLLQEASKQNEAMLNDMEDQWNEIVNLIGQSQRKVTTFFRQWSSSASGKIVREKNLYGYIRRHIIVNKNYSASEYISDAKKQAQIYSALREPDDKWRELDKSSNVKQDHEVLNALNRIGSTQHFTVLLAAVETLKGREFSEFLLWIEVIAFRAVIGKLLPAILEQAYIKIVVALRKQDDALNAARAILMEIYTTHMSLFAEQFAAADISKTNMIRYILVKLERMETQMPISFDSSDVTIEHILPQNPRDGDYQDFDRTKLESYSGRLGNYCLLSSTANKEASNNSFDAKKKIYANCAFKTTQQLCEYPEWSPKTLAERQKNMATKAVTIWSID